MQQISDADKKCFTVKRYMDDIILLYSKRRGFDHQHLIESLETQCYLNPLTLEPGDPKTFLESTIEIRNNKIYYRLKNDNFFTQNIWRYAHFDSYAPLSQKRGVLLSTMKKTHRMTSDCNQLIISAVQKLYEFVQIAYPKWVIRKVCNNMASTTREPTWFKIREIVCNEFY